MTEDEISSAGSRNAEKYIDELERANASLCAEIANLHEVIERLEDRIYDTEPINDEIHPEKVLRRMVSIAESVARRRKLPIWSIVGQWTGFGSGYSCAIVQRYGTELASS